MLVQKPSRKWIPWAVHASLILAILACALPGAGLPAPEASPTAESSSSIPVSTATQFVPSPTLEPQPQPEEFVEFYRQQVDSGAWTEADGLVFFLEAALGRRKLSLPESIDDTELSGILALAGLYLENGSDETAKAEIRQLLDLLFPAEEKIESYAIPESLASRSTAKVAAPAPQAEQNCAALWADGFPPTNERNYPCFFYGETSTRGIIDRVYAPLAWHGDASKFAYYQSALTAMQESRQVFSAFGSLVRTYAIFAYDLGDGGALGLVAEAGGQAPGEACPVIIYPPALLMDEATFKQAIAHEMFHCFQNSNFRMYRNYNSEIAAWYIEGSAEYFSNVVYPEVDYEYRNIAKLNERSLTRPLYQMSYGNFLFFQYMGNQWGNQKIIEMMAAMPLNGSLDDALNAIVAYPGLTDLFEGYARAFLSNQIADSAGHVYPYTPVFARVNLVGGSQNGTLNQNAFVLYREKFTYSPGQVFTFSTTASPAQVRIGSAPIEFPAWEIPSWQVDTSCNQWDYMTYSIGVTNDRLGRTVDYTIDASPVAAGSECTECLVGIWKLDPNSYLQYANSLFPSRMNVATAVGYDGEMFIEYTREGKTMATFNNFMVVYKGNIEDINGGPPIQTSMEVKFLPVGTAVGYTASETVITYNGPRSRVKITGKMFTPSTGETFPFNADPNMLESTLAGNSETYVCKGNFLAVIPILPPSVPNKPMPILFTRYLPPSP